MWPAVPGTHHCWNPARWMASTIARWDAVGSGCLLKGCALESETHVGFGLGCSKRHKTSKVVGWPVHKNILKNIINCRKSLVTAVSFGDSWGFLVTIPHLTSRLVDTLTTVPHLDLKLFLELFLDPLVLCSRSCNETKQEGLDLRQKFRYSNPVVLDLWGQTTRIQFESTPRLRVVFHRLVPYFFGATHATKIHGVYGNVSCFFF